jgi:hypothetical protein
MCVWRNGGTGWRWMRRCHAALTGTVNPLLLCAEDQIDQILSLLYVVLSI